MTAAKSNRKAGEKARKKQPRGLAVYTERGSVPWWVTAERTVLLLALAATIPFVIGVEPGRRLFWAAAIASLPLSWVVFGYHLWRRVCPLAVVAQLGRLIGRPGQRRVGAKSWLAENYMLVQLAIMVVALSLRLIMTNGTPWALAGFLLAAAGVAAALGFVYTGKTWCNYICPVGMVEKIYTEPSRLLGLSNSQCSPCTACKKNCPDIDLEQGYWKELMNAARRRAYFAWPGVVLAFYTYYYLVAGDWSYYFSGDWTLEDTQITRWLDPGFYFLGEIPIAVAAPLTLVAFGVASLLLFTGLERVLRTRAGAAKGEPTPEDSQRLDQEVRHRMLALTGFIAFIIFYYFGGQPTIRMLPGWFAVGFSTAVTVAATAMLVRRWRRSEADFVQEKFAEKILKKWEWGDKPESEDLHDIYLVHHERKRERDARLGAYKETVREMVADGLVTRNELTLLGSLRAQLGISDKDHQRILDQLSDEEKQLFDPAYQGSVEMRVQNQQYRRALEAMVLSAARTGSPPAEADLEAVRREFGIDTDEHRRALAEVRGDSGPLIDLCRDEIAEVKRLAAAMASAQATPGAATSSSVALLRDLCRLRARGRLRRGLAALAQSDSHEPGLAPATSAEALLSANPSERREARRELETGLGELGTEISSAAESLWAPPGEEPASQDLIALMADPSPHIRAIAAHVLSRFDDDEARDAAARAMDDEVGLVREAAAYALGVRGRLKRDLMARALKDPDERVRRAALSAMSPGGSSSAPHSTDAVLARAEAAQTAGVFATFDASSNLETLSTLEKMALLRRVPLFSGLDPEDLEEASLLAEERGFEVGAELCREGEEGDEVFVIIDGQVEVWTAEAAGDAAVGGDAGSGRRVLGAPGSGACIGEMSVLDSAPRSATVTASRPTRTLVLPAAEFRGLIQSRPAVGQAVIDVLVGRLRRAIESR